MKTIILVLALTLAVALPAHAQQYLTTTTLNGSITASATQITVASGTNVQANGAFYIEQEFIPILSCANAGCTIANVARTQKPVAHASGQQVFVATAALKPLTMLTHSAALRVGQCSTVNSSVRATALAGIVALPIIDMDTGWVYDCRRNGPVVSNVGAWVWNVIINQQLNSVAASTWAQ